MIRHVGIAAAIVIAVAPALAARDHHFLWGGCLAGAICLGGILRPSLRMASIGCVLAVVVLTVALFAQPGPEEVLGSFICGAGVLVLLDATAFREQSVGLQLERKIAIEHFRATAISFALAVVAASVLVVLDSLVTLRIDAPLRPLLAVGGGISCFGAAAHIWLKPVTSKRTALDAECGKHR